MLFVVVSGMYFFVVLKKLEVVFNIKIKKMKRAHVPNIERRMKIEMGRGLHVITGFGGSVRVGPKRFPVKVPR